MTPYYEDEAVTLWHGDCLDVLAILPDASVDAVVTDPPAGIGFMGRDWDGDKGGREAWSAWFASVMREALRVTKPGGHALVWALPRTAHWTACGLEDAGWVIRDRIVHLFGTGFPKSLDVSKAIDKAAGAEREVVGYDASRARPNRTGRVLGDVEYDRSDNGATLTASATDAARTWQGWGTALKPAAEDWWLCRKPLAGTVAGNVLAHGTGALNIDATRVDGVPPSVPQPKFSREMTAGFGASEGRNGEMSQASGRWPTNVVLDDTQAAALDAQSGTLTSGSLDGSKRNTVGGNGVTHGVMAGVVGSSYADSGGASRFFPTFRYEAKAPTAERPRDGDTAHPTVKPLNLMRWLIRLVTPPGGTVLDPFLGSGTTAEACILEGFRCIGIEREPAYLPLAVARLSKPLQVGLDFGGVSA